MKLINRLGSISSYALGVALGLVVTLSPSTSSAEISVAEWRAHSPDEREVFLVWITGAIVGFTWSNALLENRQPEGGEIFCLPRRLSLTTEQAESIMKDHAEKLEADGQSIDEMPAGLLLTLSLIDVFPCEANQRAEH